MNKYDEAIDLVEETWKRLVGDYRYQNAKKIDTEEAYYLALEALKQAKERENPQPLTLEQLKERVGKPVWYFDKNTKEKTLFIPIWVYSNYMRAFCIQDQITYRNRRTFETIESFDINETDFYDHEPKGE